MLANRNPLLLFRLDGLLLLRFAERALFALLFHEPPRNTRFDLLPVPVVRPPAGLQFTGGSQNAHGRSAPVGWKRSGANTWFRKPRCSFAPA